MATSPALLDLITAHDQGVLATIRRDGRPQLSTVNYAYDEGARLLRVSITDGRAKTANLRRDPRAALHVSSPDGWSYAVADGAADLSAVATAPDDDAVAELIELYRAIGGEHDDWDDYRRAMIADGRLVLRLHVDHLYGQAR
ncbi:PPOX class F420-dependent oxidoreductase [Williamsia maris]|uniref:PPOX class probable F420-dependent enzyme n=1 Tax=Williamsia maris TaxID=72806 RepID=A0ABT1HAY5_9NOCA|nr:PPOX class F420-dependent oxidoreductase [Williamsia maris]MCP2175403.1 PPOX class probable F420-dependent enzyme [Williamsia maris]